MCGISGLINKDGRPVEQSAIQQINDIVAHRGPDGEGFYIKSNFAFGHRRLAILDLSDAGHQPMVRGNLCITFNGEIYNYIEIKNDLEKRGVKFKSGSDTEVILAAYEHWGEECVSHFRGMWAFAIYDERSEQIFCSRDRFGIKPFYYTETNRQFAFGSEIKQLLTFQNQLTANKQIVFDYLLLGYHQHTNETFFKNVLKLPAGHNLIFKLSNNKVEIKRYYKLPSAITPVKGTASEVFEWFDALLDESIKIHMRSDVKVGTCLSGGLDSSYIAAHASRIYHQHSNEAFHAITAKSTQREYDETHYAKMVVDHSGLKWHVCEPSIDDFFGQLDSVIRLQEEPFGGPSILMQYYVMEAAKKTGCKVMLDGQGGDEIFLGYERYYVNYLSHLSPLKKISEFVSISKNSKLALKDVLLYNLYFGRPSVRERVLKKRASYVRPQHLSYFNRGLLESVSSTQSVTDLQSYEISFSQLPHLLQYEDRNSMFHSIEARVPFVDHKVIEGAFSLPMNYKINEGWTKYALRKSAEKVVPEKIAWRKNKLGFNAPKELWMSDRQFFVNEINNSPIADTLLENGKLSQTVDLNTLWRLYNLTKWASLFKVNWE